MQNTDYGLKKVIINLNHLNAKSFISDRRNNRNKKQCIETCENQEFVTKSKKTETSFPETQKQ